MSWQTIADLKGLGLANPRVVGDDLVVDLYDGNELAVEGFVIGNVRGPRGFHSDLDFSVVALDPGDEPTLAVTGEPGAYSLVIGMPTGPAWEAVAVPVAPGGTPTASVDEDWPVSTLTIGVPAGVQGEVGPPANLSVTVSTLAPGEAATATLTGTAPDFTLALGIPRGDTGAATAAFDDDVTSSETGWTSQRITAFTSTAINNLAAGFTTALAGKANTAHTHATADVTGLDTALAGKANTAHTHDAADTVSGVFSVDRLPGAGPTDNTTGEFQRGITFFANAGFAATPSWFNNEAVSTFFLRSFRPALQASGFSGGQNQQVGSGWAAMRWPTAMFQDHSAHLGFVSNGYKIRPGSDGVLRILMHHRVNVGSGGAGTAVVNIRVATGTNSTGEGGTPVDRTTFSERTQQHSGSIVYMANFPVTAGTEYAIQISGDTTATFRDDAASLEAVLYRSFNGYATP